MRASAMWAAAWASASPKEGDERKLSSRKGRSARADDESGAGAGESAEGALTASAGDEVAPEEQTRVVTDEGDASSDTEERSGSK
jgi:hypothetical protein